MLRKPSDRRKQEVNDIVLNLVPLMDALVTLICFLLFTSAFLAIAEIESPAPIVSDQPPSEEEQKNPPIQLTAKILKDVIWLEAGFGTLYKKSIQKIPNPDPRHGEDPDELIFDFEALHAAFLKVKEQFPKETNLIVIPSKEIKYDVLVQIIDEARQVKKTDEITLTVKNEDGVEEAVKELFPNIIFGNVFTPI